MKIQDLTTSERIILAEKLWDSLVEENAKVDVTDKQMEELDMRLQAFLGDQERGSSWTEVKERIIGQE